jgi:hypothetical protein
VPEAQFFTFFPPSWSGKIEIKIRRATQLIRIWVTSLLLLKNGKLVLPERIVLPEAFLYLINPILFITSIFATLILFMTYPLAFVLLLLLLVPKIRLSVFELIQDNFILFLALIAALFNRRYIIWKKAEDSRSSLDITVLEKLGLI